MKKIIGIILKSFAISFGVYTLKKYLVKTAIGALKNERALKLLTSHQQMIDDGLDKFFEKVLTGLTVNAQILRWNDKTDSLHVVMLIGISVAEYTAMDAAMRDKKLVEIIVKRSLIRSRDNNSFSTATMVYHFAYRREAVAVAQFIQETAQAQDQSIGLNIRPGSDPNADKASNDVLFNAWKSK